MSPFIFFFVFLTDHADVRAMAGAQDPCHPETLQKSCIYHHLTERYIYSNPHDAKRAMYMNSNIVLHILYTISSLCPHFYPVFTDPTDVRASAGA